LKEEEVTYWREEMKILDKLYDKKMKEWQTTADLYDLKFDRKIRDLEVQDLIKVPRFYRIVRQLIATVAFNYPTLAISIEDDDSGDMAELLERASASLLDQMDAKPHVHQAIFDSLICGVGWLRNDYNPAGDEMIPPYIANDSMEEDLPAISRVPPGFVQVDPTTPPHMFGHARYIRERMWVLHEFLMQEKGLQNKKDIKPSSADKSDRIGFGEPMVDNSDDPSGDATKNSIRNGKFVLIDRIHDRLKKRLNTFVDGVLIKEEDHPFRKLVFPQVVDQLNNPVFDEDGETPLLDLDNPQEGTGWLVENGFQFIPIKFDMHPSSFIPKAHLKYVEDLQYGIVESMSRQASMLKRTSRQGVISRSESMANPELKENLKKGVDGEWHDVEDVNSIRELNYGTMPSEQYAFEDRCKMYEEEMTRVTEIAQDGPVRSATESAQIGAAVQVNREWMEIAVADVYELVVRNSFQMMGDPRYESKNFKINVAPDGQQRFTRVLRSSDFLWTYRIRVKAGSMQPLFAQVQQEKALQFYDRAIQSPNFERIELDKFMASVFNPGSIEKLMVSDTNPEAERAAQFENEMIISQFRDPGVIQGQDHQAHNKIHSAYQNHPTYQQLQQQAQQIDFQGQQVNVAAQQQIDYIDNMMNVHMQQHVQQEQAEQAAQVGPQRAVQTNAGDLISQVRSNAQKISDTLTAQEG